MTDSSSKRKRILFLYPDPPGFSGQRRASELMLEVFEDSPKFELIAIKLPGLPKTGGGLRAYWRFSFFTTASICSLIYHSIFSGITGAFIALCQTRSTLIREEFLIGLIRLLCRQSNLPIGYRLDGSNFTRWSGNEDVAQKFRKVLGKGKFVSVLGPTQREIIGSKFQSNDLTPVIVPNTCEFDAVSADEVTTKQSMSGIKVLHLSSLMEPKGYIQIVESVKDMPQVTRFTLCGKITLTQYDQRFSTVADATNWLEQKTGELSQLTWIRGAFGEEKRQLFLDAQIFVMPTDYPVEAQPLVLLEAMACGCVIVTTSVGEIGYMVDDSNAIILENKSAAQVSTAINRLAGDEDLRVRLALRGREQFLARFSKDQNKKTWNQQFGKTYV